MMKFMLLYMAPVAAEEQIRANEEAMKEGMKPWFEWFAKVGDAIVDQGMPLGNAVHLTKNGSEARKTEIAGYAIIQAENMEAAKKLLENHPHYLLGEGASIEVLEFIPLPGM